MQGIRVLRAPWSYRATHACLIGIAVVFVLCAVPAAAYSVSSAQVPQGPLRANEKVHAEVTLAFLDGYDVTFPADDSLRFYTDLDKAQWSYTVNRHGRESAKGAKQSRYFVIDGFVLSYPGYETTLTLTVTLNAYVPASPQRTFTVMQIQQIAPTTAARPNSETLYTATLTGGAVAAATTAVPTATAKSGGTMATATMVKASTKTTTVTAQATKSSAAASAGGISLSSGWVPPVLRDGPFTAVVGNNGLFSFLLLVIFAYMSYQENRHV